jgi:hypothetical protein
MPLQNDDSVPNDALLYRILRPDWITTEDGKRRPTSNALLDSNREASLFEAGPGVLEELRRLFPGYEIASVRASVIRAAQLVIQRRPEECHEDFQGDRASHVVVGPSDDIGEMNTRDEPGPSRKMWNLLFSRRIRRVVRVIETIYRSFGEVELANQPTIP